MLVLACAWACGGKSGRDGDEVQTTGGSSGRGASSGGTTSVGGAGTSAGMSPAQGGVPGAGFSGSSGSSGGSEPVSGMTGAGAVAGSSSGAGAASGAGGTAGNDDGGMAGALGEAGAPSFPECVVTEDCEIAKDCCNCHAVPKGTSVPVCRVDCGDSNACAMQGLPAVAECVLGRCTVGTSCGGDGVTCDEPAPVCPAGQAPSRSENCWGPCIASTECSTVTGCDACGDAHCVEFPSVGGTIIRCVPRETACEVGNLCECLQPCGGFGCSEQDGKIGCFCAGC